MKTFVQIVSKFPFAGKLAIRPAFRNFARAKKDERHGPFGWLSVLLSFLIYGHGAQAAMGISALQRLIIMRLSYKVFWWTVFVGYTAVNVAVTLAQLYLLIFSFSIYAGEKTTALLGRHEDYTFREVIVMFVVTFGGQMLFQAGYVQVS